MASSFKQSMATSTACNRLIEATRHANSLVTGGKGAHWNIKTNVNEDDTDKSTFEISVTTVDDRTSRTMTLDQVELVNMTTAKLVDMLVDLYLDACSKEPPAVSQLYQKYSDPATRLFIIIAECVGANVDLIGRYQVSKSQSTSNTWEVTFYSHAGSAITRMIDIWLLSPDMMHWAIGDAISELRQFTEAGKKAGLVRAIMTDSGVVLPPLVNPEILKGGSGK